MTSSIWAFSRSSAMSSSRIRPATPGVYGAGPTAPDGYRRTSGVRARHEYVDPGKAHSAGRPDPRVARPRPDPAGAAVDPLGDPPGAGRDDREGQASGTRHRHVQ